MLDDPYQAAGLAGDQPAPLPAKVKPSLDLGTESNIQDGHVRQAIAQRSEGALALREGADIVTLAAEYLVDGRSERALPLLLRSLAVDPDQPRIRDLVQSMGPPPR